MHKVACDVIRAGMKATGRTQKQEAEDIGISQKKLNQILKHTAVYPDRDEQDKIAAKYLNMTRDHMLGPLARR